MPEIVEDQNVSAKDITDEEIEAAPDVDADGNVVETEAKDESTPGDWMTDDLLERADEYGFDRESVERIGDPDKLEAAMLAFDRKFARQTRENRKQPEPKPEPKPETKQPSSFKPFKLENVEEMSSADVAKLVEFYNNAMSELHDRTEKMQQTLSDTDKFREEVGKYLHSQESRRVENEITSFFETLGDEYKEVFGSGKNLSKKASTARQEVIDWATDLEESTMRRTGRQPSIRQMLERGLQLSHPISKIKKQKEDREKAIAQRSSQHIAPPMRRNGTVPGADHGNSYADRKDARLSKAMDKVGKRIAEIPRD